MMEIRPYQQDALDSVFREWEQHDSTLIVCATGTGKTVMTSHIIKEVVRRGWGRVMCVVHREELADQTAATLHRVLGPRSVDIEMADRWADSNQFWKAPTIVASVQTLLGSRGGRIERFNPDDFGLIWLDEAHHYVSEQWKKVIAHFRQNPKCKVLGATATADRADEIALGQIFDSVAFNYEILDAIADGWLVNVEQQLCVITGLDFSRVRTNAGDFNQADLAQVMEEEKPLCEVVSATLEISAGRRTLVFAASVLHAEKMAALFNNAKPECARWICGETPKDERRKIFRDYREGVFQILVNVSVVTEGVDVPGIEVVSMAKPTKSRAVYAQAIGRALRPLPGIVDGIETVRGRLMAIDGSNKRTAVVIDFVGNSGKHKLVNSADLLGGKESDEVVERANEIMQEKKGMMTQDAIEQARDEIDKEREKSEEVQRIERSGIVAKTTYYLEKVDPFGIYDLRPQREKGWDKIRPVTDKQKSILTKQGIDFSAMNATEMKAAVNAVFKRMKEHKCSLPQAKLLRKYKLDVKDMGFQEASQMITAIKDNGWRLPESLKPKVMVEA